MENTLELLQSVCKSDKIMVLVIVAIVADTLFGTLRAIKEKKINSSIGIDGILRKVGMLLALLFCVIVDYIVGINIVGWVPDSVMSVLRAINLNVIGLEQFFGFLFAIFESLSVLKNLKLLGIPIPKGIDDALNKIFETYTDELPSTHKNDK